MGQRWLTYDIPWGLRSSLLMPSSSVTVAHDQERNQEEFEGLCEFLVV